MGGISGVQSLHPVRTVDPKPSSPPGTSALPLTLRKAIFELLEARMNPTLGGGLILAACVHPWLQAELGFIGSGACDGCDDQARDLLEYCVCGGGRGDLYVKVGSSHERGHPAPKSSGNS